MTDREDIIKMAREAGCIPRRHPEYDNDIQVFATPDVLERFYQLAVASERERIIAANAPEIERINAYIKELEEAIRARGQDPMPLFDDWDGGIPYKGGKS